MGMVINGVRTSGVDRKPKSGVYQDVSANPNIKSAIDAMISGSAFQPFRAAAQEGQARNQQYQRAQVAAMLNKAGMANSGFGSQMARSSTATMRGQAFQNKLATQQAQNAMMERGAGLGQQQQQLELDNAEKAARYAQAEKELASSERQGASTRALERERMGTSAQLERERLAQNAMLESGRMGLSKQQLAQEKELAQGEQGLRGRSLDIQEKQWTDELGLKQQDMDLRKQIGLEDLSLRSRALSSQEQQTAKELDFKFKELDQRDKQVMAQIDLGKEELSQRDKQFLANMGLSQKAQAWLETYQKESLKGAAEDREIRRGKSKARAEKDQRDYDLSVAEMGAELQTWKDKYYAAYGDGTQGGDV